MQTVIDGIEITITRKAIKNMYLYVKPPDGRVELSAPMRQSEDSIRAFILLKLGWIRRRQEQIARRSVPQKRAFVAGEPLYVWGRKYVLRVTEGKRYSLVLEGDDALFTVRGGSASDRRERFVNEWYRALLIAEIKRLLPKWEGLTGLQPSSWQTKNMTTRWGTCNVKSRKIWLSLQLAQKPKECLGYVIVHELTHLKERGHNARFQSLMDQFMPDWRERKRSLNGGER